jgi:hypothetical protein
MQSVSLITVVEMYAKNERENLDQSEIKTMRKLVPVLVEMNRKRRSAS